MSDQNPYYQGNQQDPYSGGPYGQSQQPQQHKATNGVWLLWRTATVSAYTSACSLSTVHAATVSTCTESRLWTTATGSLLCRAQSGYVGAGVCSGNCWFCAWHHQYLYKLVPILWDHYANRRNCSFFVRPTCAVKARVRNYRACTFRCCGCYLFSCYCVSNHRCRT